LPEQYRLGMAAPASFTTHVIEVGDDQVIKRFRSWDRGEHVREWRALTLLATYAPDLAPTPLGTDLTSTPPYVRMSRVPGRPLDGQKVTPGVLDAIAAAIGRLHAAVPRDVVARQPPQPWLAIGVVSQMRSIVAASPAKDGDALARSALDAGRRWLGRVADPRAEEHSVVFGQGDANLANYLWDGERVRLVDFEDSGRSDRAFELAAFAEHVSVWHDAGVETGGLLGRLELTRSERARVLFFRRAFALYWLLKLLDRGEACQETLYRQASRLLAVLDG
jgi:aminoglycoside phosphotransferase